MTREDIYDHLAQVYLGKRKEADVKKKKHFSVWLAINLVITFIIFASATYGLTAYLAQHGSFFENNIIFTLHKGSIRMEYNFNDFYHPSQEFSLSIPPMDATKYKTVEFSIRGKEEGTPGIIKVTLRNQKNEVAFVFIRDIDLRWQKIEIPLEEFQNITDFTSLTSLSFVVENWNVANKKGIVLIEDVNLSS